MNETIKQKLEVLSNEYIEAFLVFAVKRTNNLNEAEELSQEITFECVKAIHNKTNIQNFNAYLWSIAHNTYKRWLYSKKNNIIVPLFIYF